nr:beta-alanine transporter [Parasteatoda tepidariorum]
MEFEDIIKDIGGYGKYQNNMVLLFVAPVTVVLPMIMLSSLFIVSIPDHWCDVPKLEDFAFNTSEQRSLFSPDDDPSCRMYDLNFENISDFNNLDIIKNASTIPCTYGWIYDKSNYESTAATKWNLVCENSHYTSLVLTLQNVGGIVGAPITSVLSDNRMILQWNLVCENSHYTSLVLTLQNVGGIVGAPITSVLSDKYGRKIVYFSIVLLSVAVNVICPFIQDFTTFAVLRAIHGVIYPPILILPYILAMELIPPEKRTRTSYIWNFSWVVGMCILPAIVYVSRNWRIFCWIISSVGSMVLIYWNVVSESPRWLISQKRYDEARDVILKIAEINGFNPNPNSLLKKLQDMGDKIDREKKEEERSFYALINRPRLRKHFLILTGSCFANHTIYCIIHYNITNLEGNEFFNFFLLSIAEAPGTFLLWFTMERIGRRWSAVGSYIIGGIACALPITGLPYSDTVSSVAAKFIVAGLFMVTDQQICELFPTVSRSFAMGLAKSISIGLSVFQPYVIQLNVYGKALPFVIISLTCFIIGIVASFLPETLNENLPQTIEDAEEIGKDQKYFSFQRKDKCVQ